MEKANLKYFLFLLLILILSIPFYLWGAFFPIKGLPFGLPISFLMIFIPFFLALLYAFKDGGIKGITSLFASILDSRRAKLWAILFCLLCMPMVTLLTYVTMRAASLPLPAETVIPYTEIPLMVILYFLGAIPEEFGWTATLTSPLVKKYGPIPSGILIGAVWGVWHIIPWSWAHPPGWIAGMLILNILMRTAMVYAYVYGGKSLFAALLFHTMINVAIGLFPNYGSHVNTWILSVWLAVIVLLLMRCIDRTKISN